MASSQPSIFEYTWKAYTENFLLIITMALPGFVALLVPALVGTPAYRSLGGAFIRTGSIPDINGPHVAVILVGLLASLFLMSFAIVNINLVIRRERTFTHIGKEVMQHLTTTTLSVFWIALVLVMLLFIVQLLSFEWGVQKWLSPLLSFVIGMALLLVPTAMVMDETRPWRAFEKSIDCVVRKWPLILLWLVLGLVCISIVDGIALLVLPNPFGSYFTLLFNSIIILPYLIVMLGQIYISKYTILA